MVISCFVNICWNPRLTRRNPKETHYEQINDSQPGGTTRQPRSNSGLYRTLQPSRASRVRHSEFDDDDDSWSWDDTLMMNEFNLANSTPMTTRKVTKLI